MPPMRSALLLPLALGSIVLSGCAEPEADGASSPADPIVDEQELVSKGGVSLRAASDPGLRISLMMLPGVKTKTKNQRFIKATVSRGSKSFGAFCNLHGERTATTSKAVVSCSLGISTVSNDDDEALVFGIALERTASGETVSLEDVGYSGDGTFLGTQAAILGHDGSPSISLSAQEANNPAKNVLQFARTVLDGTGPLLAERVISEANGGEPFAVKSLSFTLDTKLMMSTVLRLGRTGRLWQAIPEQSLLEVPGDLSKGVLDQAEITVRLKAAIPR